MIGSRKMHSKYRDTGLPWLPTIPESWDLMPNRSLLRKRKVLVGERHQQFRLLSLTKNGVVIRDVTTGKGKFSKDIGTCQEIRSGDLIFCLFDIPETPRTVGLSAYDGMITGAYTVFECQDAVLARFLELFYIAMDDRKLLAPLYTGLRNTIPPSRFLAVNSPIPPSDEQAAIVRFLDYADRRIRRYIRVKHKLIELLNEQKMVLIHQAVTRGLDPNVHMAETGQVWIPRAPAHWKLTPNRAHLRYRRILVGDCHSQFDLLSLTKHGVIVRDVSDNKGKFSKDPGSAQEVRKGDLVFCLFDVPETPRTVGLSRLNGMITGAYTVFECADPDIAEFLEAFYIAMDDRKLLAPLYSGLRNTIPKERLLGAKTPLPPRTEIQAILSHIREHAKSSTDAIEQVRNEVALLHELRIRLIADVVTGQLDVRAAAATLPDDPTDDEPLDDADELPDNAGDDARDTPEEDDA